MLDHRVGNRLNQRSCNRGVDLRHSVDHRLHNWGVVDSVDSRVDLGSSGNMTVGVDWGSVVEGVVKKGVSLSLSLPLDNMLDRSILGNVLGAKGTIGDSSVVLRVVVVCDGVGGHLGLGVDHRAGNMLDHRGGNRLNQ